MKIIYKKIEELIPYENNPRINDQAVSAVAASIKEFGFKVPCVIDKNGVIITGHTRYKAAQELGLTEIPCIIADDLTEEQAAAFRLIDNKTSEFSYWDYDKLQEEMDGLDGVLNMYEFGFELPKQDLPMKEETQQFESKELDLDDFSDEEFSHVCERCGFKWN